MRIGIDARFYGPIGKGLGRYTQKLIENLERLDTANDYVIFLRGDNWADYQPRNPRFRKVLADYRWYTVKEQVYLPLAIYKQRIQVMHFPHFNVPILYFGKFIVTIHDLILLQYPTKRATTLGPLMYAMKLFGYRWVIRRAVRRARALLTVSEYTKAQLIESFRLPAHKIVVTHEAVDPEQSSIATVSQTVLNQYRIKKPYILYVGNAYPHKNLERLICAYKLLIESGVSHYLVLVGKHDYFYERLKKEVALLNLQGRVLFPGFVTDKDLPAIYEHASVYTFPSLLEGFGLPPLEAMAHGVPVVAARSSSLPEVLGDAARYCDPQSEEDIAAAIYAVLEDANVRQIMIQRGLKRVSLFSWDKLATTTQSLYLQI